MNKKFIGYGLLVVAAIGLVYCVRNKKEDETVDNSSNEDAIMMQRQMHEDAMRMHQEHMNMHQQATDMFNSQVDQMNQINNMNMFMGM